MGRHQVVVNEKTDATVGERAKENMLIGVGCNHIVTCRGSRHFFCGDDDDAKKQPNLPSDKYTTLRIPKESAI